MVVHAVDSTEHLRCGEVLTSAMFPYRVVFALLWIVLVAIVIPTFLVALGVSGKYDVYIHLPGAFWHDKVLCVGRLGAFALLNSIVPGLVIASYVRSYLVRRWRWRRRPALWSSETNADLESQRLAHLEPELFELVSEARNARIRLGAHDPMSAQDEAPTLRVGRCINKLSRPSRALARELGISAKPLYEGLAAAQGSQWFAGLLSLDAALQHVEMQLIRHAGRRIYR